MENKIYKFLVNLNFILIVVVSCKTNLKNLCQNTEYSDYIKKIPLIDLPLEINCDSDFSLSKLIVSDSLIKKYGIEGAYIYGKLNIKKKFEAVIYLVVAEVYIPILRITNASGNLIDELILLQSCYGTDWEYSRSWVKITPKLEIIMKDTIKRWQLDTLNEINIIEGSEKVEVKTRTFFIDKVGKIVPKIY